MLDLASKIRCYFSLTTMEPVILAIELTKNQVYIVRLYFYSYFCRSKYTLTGTAVLISAANIVQRNKYTLVFKEMPAPTLYSKDFIQMHKHFRKNRSKSSLLSQSWVPFCTEHDMIRLWQRNWGLFLHITLFNSSLSTSQSCFANWFIPMMGQRKMNFL